MNTIYEVYAGEILLARFYFKDIPDSDCKLLESDSIRGGAVADWHYQQKPMHVVDGILARLKTCFLKKIYTEEEIFSIIKSIYHPLRISKTVVPVQQTTAACPVDDHERVLKAFEALTGIRLTKEQYDVLKSIEKLDAKLKPND